MAPATAPVSETHAEVFRAISIEQFVPSPTNPRRHFDAKKLDELADSIRQKGVVVPLLVRQIGKGVPRFEIVAGERRYRAAKLAGLTGLQAIVRDLSDQDVLELQLIENIQRDDLDPLEEARGYKALVDSNPAKFSAAYIADRIGRSEKFVWDRMKLLDLIPEIKQLLEHERILVGHGELLAKLKPEDQRRAIDTSDREFGRERSGLWRHESTLFDEDRDEATEKDPFRGLKPVTVRELEAWIARHVRFDVQHAAKAAPLDFGPVAEQVQQAAAQPGRGRKVISITDDYRVEDDAKDPSERTYGSQSWRRADGQEKSKTCDHSVLGVFVAGPGYGSTLRVCIERDRCEVHFAKEIKAREKNATLRAKGQGPKADAREKRQKQQWEIEQEKRQAEEQAWAKLRAGAIAAITTHVAAQSAKALLKRVAESYLKGKAAAGVKHADDLIRALACQAATSQDWYRDGIRKNAKAFGFNLTKWIADQAPKPISKVTKTTKKAKAKR